MKLQVSGCGTQVAAIPKVLHVVLFVSGEWNCKYFNVTWSFIVLG
jgi:hypothetical protein